MTFPDFSKIALNLDATGQGPTRDPWLTPEGLTVQTAYGADSTEALDHPHGHRLPPQRMGRAPSRAEGFRPFFFRRKHGE